ncbi:MAG: SDR family oxidoreductase [Bacteroidota bacterium]
MSDQKIALVTGANRGIGLEVCRQFLDLGHHVILTSRDEDKGRKAAAELNGDKNLTYHPLDVGSDESVMAVKGFVEREFGRLDILVNNAGINYDTWQTAVGADLEESHYTLEINLFGPWRMSQAFIPLMKKKGYGRIVNVSSGAGALNGMRGGTPAYSVSKAGLNALTIKLAAEVQEPNILVNAVCPGWVRTDMGGSDADRSVEEGAKGIIWAAIIEEGNGPNGGFFRDEKKLEW